jgi:hypothetical protein
MWRPLTLFARRSWYAVQYVDPINHSSWLTWDLIANRMQRNVTNLEFDPTKVHPTDATKQVIANMLLLGATDMLIGKFTSNVFRIAFQLMVAQSPAGHMKPFISLDRYSTIHHALYTVLI